MSLSVASIEDATVALLMESVYGNCHLPPFVRARAGIKKPPVRVVW